MGDDFTDDINRNADRQCDSDPASVCCPRNSHISWFREQKQRQADGNTDRDRGRHGQGDAYRDSRTEVYIPADYKFSEQSFHLGIHQAGKWAG